VKHDGGFGGILADGVVRVGSSGASRITQIHVNVTMVAHLEVCHGGRRWLPTLRGHPGDTANGFRSP
jgi:hypothetical protein